jgi:hypothetical protein
MGTFLIKTDILIFHYSMCEAKTIDLNKHL